MRIENIEMLLDTLGIFERGVYEIGDKQIPVKLSKEEREKIRVFLPEELEKLRVSPDKMSHFHEARKIEFKCVNKDSFSVAREMNELLDREDFIPDSYTFEVSSPGLGRPLKKEKDYVRNMGKEIEIRTYRAIDRCKEFTGILKAYDDTSVTIADENDKETTFLKTDIALIRQAIDF